MGMKQGREHPGFVPLLHQYTPSGQTSEVEWQTDRCLLHTTVMFYQPLRPCQSMAGMFQNIFNTQREHFGLRKWIVHKIGRRLSGCVNHQRPFVLPPLQASGTQTLPFVSFVFICIINCFTFGSRRKKSSKTVASSHTGDYCPTGKSGIHNAQLCSACFCESANLHISRYADDECRMRGDGHE